MSRSPVNAGWGNWSQQQPHHPGYMMETSGYQYDSRVVSSAPLVQPTLAPQYVGGHQYALPSMPPRDMSFTNNHGHYHYQQHYEQPAQPVAMSYARYSPPAERSPLPSGHHHDMVQQRSFSSQHLPIHLEHRQLSPSIKSEVSRASSTIDPKKSKNITYNKPVSEEEVVFTTPIDVMMKALQEKKQREHCSDDSHSSSDDSIKSEPSTPGSAAESTGSSAKVKKYRCRFDMCNKSFSQSTHLSTHERAHTGEKPFACDYPGCNRSFSQPGNLKTHRRLHTGERPFICGICQSAFAQRGNLKAHMGTHNNSKPFECKLEECHKCFTTRGNLKNHQNKYHTTTIHKISDWIMSLSEDEENLTLEEQELITYFRDIYKNSNKGIKGRGRDRRVSDTRMGKSKSVMCSNIPQHRRLTYPECLDTSRIGVVSY
ncbi:zinc finger protein [Plectosphaerella plurivora]|uniref:Zinc finger protein n=1 Tax=Plectosphaerella plurivora TaxID=936078 RepID=A0A9P8V8V6_9PEZI|nr:zinc finger protein [Plectosphaerella plurivora]